jgi:hypothetical protein
VSAAASIPSLCGVGTDLRERSGERTSPDISDSVVGRSAGWRSAHDTDFDIGGRREQDREESSYSSRLLSPVRPQQPAVLVADEHEWNLLLRDEMVWERVANRSLGMTDRIPCLAWTA